MEWFKFYGTEYLSDPKMLALSASERSCWVTLLSYASVSKDGGRVKYLSEDQLMTAANINPVNEEWDRTIGVLEKFENLGMVTQSNGEVTVVNWQKRQETYLTGAQRAARYREKHKSNARVTPDTLLSNARIEENRIEENKEIPKGISSSESVRYETYDASKEEEPARAPKKPRDIRAWRLKEEFYKTLEKEHGSLPTRNEGDYLQVVKALKKLVNEKHLSTMMEDAIASGRAQTVRGVFTDREIDIFAQENL